MATLLFPGRHIVNTRFQEQYLSEVLGRPLGQLEVWNRGKLGEAETLDKVVFAITSINQEHSRYNPIDGKHRFVAVDRFARLFRESLGVDARIVGIPHYHSVERFAEYMLKEITEQTEGELNLNSENTIVLSSTPEVIKLYQTQGFGILGGELCSLDPMQYRAETPILVMKKIAAAGEKWKEDGELRRLLSTATLSTWFDFPEISKRVLWLYRDPLLNEQGSLTKTRDYATYTQGMSNPLILEAKYDDIKRCIVAGGRLVDEGCADGSLLARIARDFRDVDMLGIEITAEYIQQCEEKQRQGAYQGNYAHFHQRNLMERIFEDNSITTTICNSTTHELWSYGEQEKTVRTYLGMKHDQLRHQGRIIIRDVVGPEDKEKEVYLWCNDADGSEEDIFRNCADAEVLAGHLRGLSTYGRFKRFAEDFLAEMRESGKRSEETKIRYREEVVNEERYVVLRLKDAAEFLSKKDYVDNWQSELNEEFAFWSFSEWKNVLSESGFHVLENPNAPLAGSRAYASEWIVKNRYEGKVKLFERTDVGLNEMEYPVTNMVLVGEKR